MEFQRWIKGGPDVSMLLADAEVDRVALLDSQRFRSRFWLGMMLDRCGDRWFLCLHPGEGETLHLWRLDAAFLGDDLHSDGARFLDGQHFERLAFRIERPYDEYKGFLGLSGSLAAVVT